MGLKERVIAALRRMPDGFTFRQSVQPTALPTGDDPDTLSLGLYTVPRIDVSIYENDIEQTVIVRTRNEIIEAITDLGLNIDLAGGDHPT